MRLKIQITAYDRINLLKECVLRIQESALELRNTHNSLIYETAVFADHRVDSREYAEIVQAMRDFGVLTLGTYTDKPIGADRNILCSLSQWCDYGDEKTYIVKLDSDILVARNFLHDMVVLANHFNGMSTSNLYGRDPLNVKRANSNNITKWAMSGANFCVSLENLEKLLPMATALIKTYKQNGHNPATTAEEWKVMKDLLRLYAPLHNEMNSPHRDFLLNSDVPNTGSDAMIAVAAWCHGIPIVSYTVNRAIHPSDTGVNTTREFWEQHYAGVTLDDLPPAEPSKFKFV